MNNINQRQAQKNGMGKTALSESQLAYIRVRAEHDLSVAHITSDNPGYEILLEMQIQKIIQEEEY